MESGVAGNWRNPVNGARMGVTRVERPHIAVTESLKVRLYGNVAKTDGGCWLWQGCVSPNGYGKIKIGPNSFDTHVISWRVASGGIAVPLGKLVMHQCDVRACINPEHLTVGTQSENMLHASAVGAMRNPKGSRHYRAVLNETVVSEILSLKREGKIGCRKIARLLGLRPSTVHSVIIRSSWKHVE